MNYKGIEIEFNGSELFVEFEGHCEIEDCSFSHAFGTEECFGVICNITWNKNLFTTEENVAIEQYVQDNYTDLENYFTESYEAPEYEYEPDFEFED